MKSHAFAKELAAEREMGFIEAAALYKPARDDDRIENKQLREQLAAERKRADDLGIESNHRYHVILELQAQLAAEREKLERIDDFFRDPNNSFMVEGETTFERVRNYTQELDAEVDQLREQLDMAVEALRMAEKDLRLAFNTTKDSYGAGGQYSYNKGLVAVVTALAKIKEGKWKD